MIKDIVAWKGVNVCVPEDLRPMLINMVKDVPILDGDVTSPINISTIGIVANLYFKDIDNGETIGLMDAIIDINSTSKSAKIADELKAGQLRIFIDIMGTAKKEENIQMLTVLNAVRSVWIGKPTIIN